MPCSLSLGFAAEAFLVAGMKVVILIGVLFWSFEFVLRILVKFEVDEEFFPQKALRFFMHHNEFVMSLAE